MDQGSGVTAKCIMNLVLPWLWPSRLAAAALIPPLAWELPCAESAALKKKKKKAFPGLGVNLVDSLLPPLTRSTPIQSDLGVAASRSQNDQQPYLQTIPNMLPKFQRSICPLLLLLIQFHSAKGAQCLVLKGDETLRPLHCS